MNPLEKRKLFLGQLKPTEQDREPIERLEKLLPECKEKLLPADSELIQEVCENFKNKNTYFKAITPKTAEYLDRMADTQGHYLGNEEYKVLLKKAAGIMGEI